MKIGFFDSGIGGLTVLQQAMETLPEEDYIYYADTEHVPYGTKPKEEIIRYVDEAVGFLVEKGVKAIVIACNTATSVAIESVRAKYQIPILGMEPAVKPAVERCPNKRVIIAATPLTIKEDKLKNLLEQVDGEHKTDLLALPGLVLFAESGCFVDKKVEDYLKKELSAFELKNYSNFVLGCTHFNYFKDTLRKLLPVRVEFIDGTNGTVNHLKAILERNGQLEHGSSNVEYYISGKPVTDLKRLSFFDCLLKRAEAMARY